MISLSRKCGLGTLLVTHLSCEGVLGPAGGVARRKDRRMIWPITRQSRLCYRLLQLRRSCLGSVLRPHCGPGVQAITFSAASYARSASIIEQGSLPRLLPLTERLIALKILGAWRKWMERLGP